MNQVVFKSAEIPVTSQEFNGLKVTLANTYKYLPRIADCHYNAFNKPLIWTS